MVELDFNPQVGEEVEDSVNHALFEVLDRYTDGIGEVLKLRRLEDGSIFKYPSMLFLYPAEVRVRRKLKSLLAHCESFPEDFQEGRFDVERYPMYDGSPRTMVYFYLKPEVVPSVTKARVWSNFYALLREKLQPLMDSDTWLQFAAKEDRSVLSAAS